MEPPKDSPSTSDQSVPLETPLKGAERLKSEVVCLLHAIREAAAGIAESITRIEGRWKGTPDAEDFEQIAEDGTDVATHLLNMKMLWGNIPPWLSQAVDVIESNGGRRLEPRVTADSRTAGEQGETDKKLGAILGQFENLRDVWRRVPSCENKETYEYDLALLGRILGKAEQRKARSRGQTVPSDPEPSPWSASPSATRPRSTRPGTSTGVVSGSTSGPRSPTLIDWARGFAGRGHQPHARPRSPAAANSVQKRQLSVL